MRRFHAGTLWDTLGCAGILWEILGQAGIGWGRLGRAGALWVILGILGAGWGLVLPRRASHNEGSPFGRRMVELGGGHMAKQTNADRVLGLLTEAGGAWVRGAELLHPAVGGSRFGARILELRKRGYNIERRSDPKSALHQYRLVSDKRVDSSTVRQSVGEYECMGCGYRIVFGGKELLGGFIENYCGNENKRAVFKLA